MEKYILEYYSNKDHSVTIKYKCKHHEDECNCYIEIHDITDNINQNVHILVPFEIVDIIDELVNKKSFDEFKKISITLDDIMKEILLSVLCEYDRKEKTYWFLDNYKSRGDYLDIYSLFYDLCIDCDVKMIDRYIKYWKLDMSCYFIMTSFRTALVNDNTPLVQYLYKISSDYKIDRYELIHYNNDEFIKTAIEYKHYDIAKFILDEHKKYNMDDRDFRKILTEILPDELFIYAAGNEYKI
jgi:hypothetical protein